jgi:hypothetical protein
LHELCALNRLPVRAATPQQRAGSRPPRPPALRSNSTGRRTSHSGAHRGSTDSWRVFPPPHSDSVQAQATLSVFSLSLSPRTEDHDDDDDDQLTPCSQATIESDPTDLVFGVEPVYVYAAATLGCVALGWLAGPTVGGALWKLSHRGVGKAMEAKDKGLSLHHRLSLLGDGERKKGTNSARPCPCRILQARLEVARRPDQAVRYACAPFLLPRPYQC